MFGGVKFGEGIFGESARPTRPWHTENTKNPHLDALLVQRERGWEEKVSGAVVPVAGAGIVWAIA
jgi:hypothetical protein